MNILFLGCVYSHDMIGFWQSNSSRGFQFAAQNFQNSILDGFIKNDNVNLKVLTIPALSTYPHGCKLIKIDDCPFIFDGREYGQSFGFLNLPFLNHLHQSRIDIFIDRWYAKTEGDKCIIVYAMLKQQMQYAVKAKEKHPDIKLCIVIPDLPIYMACNKYYKMFGFQKHDMQAIEKLLHDFDCYVVLAEPMVERLCIVNKPYVVIEGIYSSLNVKAGDMKKKSTKTLMYAGGIVARYGVFDLLEAFHRIENDNYRLILCGPCPEMEKLNDYLLADSRIEYIGQIPTEEVRILQRQATLLVNPRHSMEEFTKYSFPSKTLEYMASGTPVLMSPLPSMPEEYKSHIYMFADESVSGMKKEIESIFEKTEVELNQKGTAAKEFIIQQKNSQYQVKKIIDFLEEKV